MHAERQRDGDHGRQSFGNRRNCQSDGGHRRLHQIVSAHHADDENQRDDKAGDDGEVFPQSVELGLQWCGRLGGVGQKAGDPAHLAVHAGGGDQRFDASARHHGVHEDHPLPFRQCRLLPDSFRALGHRVRLAGERGFGHFRRVCVEHARIGRNAVTGFEQQDVAGYQIDRRDQRCLPVAANARRRRQHVLQRRQSRLGAMLLEEAQRRV
ncbi:MAG: hypothetical protein AW07_04608 [Candidatus Accumulibacter sp. SK-11]|nr:MAG: hypothetical protein AW07_04608 [Candidatus Accumulibacter sp. SK-11]